MTVTADDLDAALASVAITLAPATDRDWSIHERLSVSGRRAPVGRGPRW
jgi:hypothetical protein